MMSPQGGLRVSAVVNHFMSIGWMVNVLKGALLAERPGFYAEQPCLRGRSEFQSTLDHCPLERRLNSETEECMQPGPTHRQVPSFVPFSDMRDEVRRALLLQGSMK